ncbi:MAG: hypothetical protein KGO96_07435 [Elusimicrobia bacterium]|nr:hypothetical protein [Elusimicrobiota bacterium]
MLKPIPYVIGKFREVSIEVAKAQLLCWKPSSEGLIYPRFDKDVHVITATQMLEKITGNKQLTEISKNDLIKYIQENKIQFYSGLDFGFTHNFAVVTGFVVENVIYIVDVICVPELEIMEKIELLNEKIKYLKPIMYPDPESPSDIKSLRKHGYDCREFKKNVLLGIDSVRTKLNPSLGVPPQFFLLKEDKEMNKLIDQMSKYHWRIDPQGNITNEPDKTDDDLVDALRYLVQNLFATSGGILVANQGTEENSKLKDVYTTQNWQSKVIKNLTEDATEHTVISNPGLIIDI